MAIAMRCFLFTYLEAVSVSSSAAAATTRTNRIADERGRGEGGRVGEAKGGFNLKLSSLPTSAN